MAQEVGDFNYASEEAAQPLIFFPGCSKMSRCKAANDARREAYLARTSQRRASAPTSQMGLFQQPANAFRLNPGEGDTR